MKISLLTDAPRHNLALMKISAFHKKAGDEVFLNMPLIKADYTYASYIFDDGIRFGAQEKGGIGVDPKIKLGEEIEKLRPDYSLFNLSHSLGYTFRDCYRKCLFCKVPQLPKEKKHHSIWEFHPYFSHGERFDTIELLNNNTFYDSLWEETFKEIYGAKLSIIDNNGNDLRLLDDHKAWWLKRLKWINQPKFAWDRMKDEKAIIEGLKLLKKHKIRGMVYVLMGFDTTMEENIYRCQKIHDFGCDPFPMLYEETKQLLAFRRVIYLRYYKSYPTIKEAWEDYSKEIRNSKRRMGWRRMRKIEAQIKEFPGL